MARKPLPQWSGERLRARREDLSMTQWECAKIADVTIATWSRWERSETIPGVDRLPAITTVLNIDDVWALYTAA